MTHLQRLLLDCLHQDSSRLDPTRFSTLTVEEWRGLLDLAARQHVRPLLLRSLSAEHLRDAVPPAPRQALADSCTTIARRNLAHHAELARLIDTLTVDGIPAILLKGAHVSTALYGDVGLREMGDLDLLVRPEHLERATSLVLGLGYAPARPFSIAVDRAVSHHVSVLFRPPHFHVELHWNLTEPRQPYAIDPSELWERAVPVGMTNRGARGLANEDLLLHLCLHVSHQHRFEFGLRSLCDLAALLARHGDALDWPAVSERAERWRWIRGVRLALQLSQDLFGARLPPRGQEALQLGRLPADLVAAATLQLLDGDDPANRPAPWISRLAGDETLGQKIGHVLRAVSPDRDDLRRAYPTADSEFLGFWAVHARRASHLVRRHTGTMLRLWVKREPALRATVDRQRQLRAYLDS